MQMGCVLALLLSFNRFSTFTPPNCSWNAAIGTWCHVASPRTQQPYVMNTIHSFLSCHQAMVSVVKVLSRPWCFIADTDNVFARACHWTLPRARRIQYPSSYSFQYYPHVSTRPSMWSVAKRGFFYLNFTYISHLLQSGHVSRVTSM